MDISEQKCYDSLAKLKESEGKPLKRSEINALIQENERFIQKMGFHLPPFASFTPEVWKEKGHEYDEIREHMLGWDVTDYGNGDFRRIGLFLFTIRNGSFGDPNCSKTYAEKLLISDEDQYSPMHFHFSKTEDLDTQWNWTIVDTIRDCIKNTMDYNFPLFRKYPFYAFNFEGAFRYKLMKEYYTSRSPSLRWTEAARSSAPARRKKRAIGSFCASRRLKGERRRACASRCR